MNGTIRAETLVLETSDSADPKRYTIQVPDGLVSNSEYKDATTAMVNHVVTEPGDSVLITDANDGTLGVVIGDETPDGDVVMTETSARAAATCQTNAQNNSVTNASVTLTPDLESVRDGFDVGVYIPKPYDPVDVVKGRIATMGEHLATGGKLYVAGTKQTGINRYADAVREVLGNCRKISVDGTAHVYRGRKERAVEAHDYVTDHKFRATVDSYTCRFRTSPGLFSWKGLDDGTRTLLEAVSVPDDAKVLDCCSGYGAIGAFIGARTDCELWLTDDNVIATTYAKQNMSLNGVKPMSIVTGDCTDGIETTEFDVVLTNPPTHAGKGVTEKLFTGIHDKLTQDGDCYLVANEIMNYDDLLATEYRFDTEIITQRDSYDVIHATPV